MSDMVMAFPCSVVMPLGRPLMVSVVRGDVITLSMAEVDSFFIDTVMFISPLMSVGIVM